MEKFRYYVVYWSKAPGSNTWTPSAQIIDRDNAIETAEDVRNISNSLAAQHNEFICVTDWKRLA